MLLEKFFLDGETFCNTKLYEEDYFFFGHFRDEDKEYVGFCRKHFQSTTSAEYEMESLDRMSFVYDKLVKFKNSIDTRQDKITIMCEKGLTLKFKWVKEDRMD